MLGLPHGVRRSVNAHNSAPSVFYDWIEADVLLSDEELSPKDVLDFLMEQQIYTKQDFCAEFVSNAWSQVRQRLSWQGTQAPLGFEGSFLARRLEWPTAPAHSFCLVVSIGPLYEDWNATFGPDYTEQGELFELLAHDAMRERFRGWEFFRTGWSRDNASTVSDVAHVLAREIGELVGDLSYASGRAHEAGVDVVWHLPFSDGRGGTPVFLAQCASGSNWFEKIGTPYLGQWRKLVDFASGPYKAFCLPLALQEREFRERSAQAEGLIVDRYRLLRHEVPEEQWLGDEVRARLVAWLAPRVEWLESRL